MEYKGLDRQLEIRMDSTQIVLNTTSKEEQMARAYFRGKIEAYQDIRGLIKDFPSLVKEEVEA